MGQYYVIANVDKKEYISPHDFNSFSKLTEFASPVSPETVTSALCILLADGNGRGGGDLESDNPIIGSWKYNRVVVAGDYADPNPEFSAEKNIYDLAHSEYKNVSIPVLLAMADDYYFAEKSAEYLFKNYMSIMSEPLFALAFAHKTRQYKDSFYGEGKDYFPNMATCAETFFTKLYPNKDSDYYRVINGIVKHYGYDENDERTLMKYENVCKEFLENKNKKKEIEDIQNQIAELKYRLDNLTK